MHNRGFKTSGRVKWVRPDGAGYIIPDKTLDGYCGINIVFDASIVQGLVAGDWVYVTFRPIGNSLVATKVKLG
jgi:hypothetical protein